MPSGRVTPTSTPPLGGYRLASGPTSLRTRRVKQSRRSGLPTGLLLFARNDGRGRVLFRNRLPMGKQHRKARLWAGAV
ncbi:MAG: hypothetical protein LBT00_05325 [Spirochaetaceae bacterium]|nr:hypothetical protein [Spirochaetaceae bacterium]